MSGERKYLRDEVRLAIRYEDQTPFGSALGGKADETVRQACSAIFEHRRHHGMALTVAHSRELLRKAFAEDLNGLYSGDRTLREECLFPPAESVRPAALLASGDGVRASDIAIGRTCLRELAPWIAEFQRGARRPASAFGRALFDELEACGALAGDLPQTDAQPEADARFVGHATVMVGRGGRILVDPFMLPPSSGYPQTYQPLCVRDLMPVDAVLITHSHPDHFDPGTLLRLGADVPIYVPAVERESLLAVDMAGRLEQLGFGKVCRIRPGDNIRAAGSSAHALPLLGEQPTTADVLHPDVRNVGCTFLCESDGLRTLLLADSGRDRTGDVRDLAGSIRDRFGDVDLVFGGYRGFAIYPIHYLFSSVARYLLFVPEGERMVRQQTMNDGDDLLDAAERCGAGLVVPYAAGGAPWFWQAGLGSRPRGSPEVGPDRAPDDIVDLAAVRSVSIEGPIASPVRVVVLRPGEGVRIQASDLRVVRGSRQLWPYDPPLWIQANLTLARVEGSIQPSVRKVFRALEPVLERWRTERRLTRFFFMRKPPGLRLRFLADKSLEGEVRALLDGLVSAGAVDSWFRAVYEPETDRFGGPEAMDAVHAWFDADASRFLVLDRIRSEGRNLLSPALFCRAVADDLVSVSLPDRAEAWAVWKHYAGMPGLQADTDGIDSVPPSEASIDRASPVERTLLGGYHEANRQLAASLEGILRQGKLGAGIRSVLAAVILFHFHRHGLDVADHRRIAAAMTRLLDPSGAGPA